MQRRGARVKGKAGGDVQQPVAQPFGFGSASSPVRSSRWVQQMRSCASRAISSQTCSAYVRDLPGCVSEGDTIDDTTAMIGEAIARYLESRQGPWADLYPR